MLSRSELRMLTAWCGRRELRWSPAQAVGGMPTMLLEPQTPRAPWQRMLLVFDEPEMRLETELGEILASASDLPAVLDAMDGGVAEPPALYRRALSRMVPTGGECRGVIA